MRHAILRGKTMARLHESNDSQARLPPPSILKGTSPIPRVCEANEAESPADARKNKHKQQGPRSIAKPLIINFQFSIFNS